MFFREKKRKQICLSKWNYRHNYLAKRVWICVNHVVDFQGVLTNSSWLYRKCVGQLKPKSTSCEKVSSVGPPGDFKPFQQYYLVNWDWQNVFPKSSWGFEKQSKQNSHHPRTRQAWKITTLLSGGALSEARFTFIRILISSKAYL